jgi:hypothetical protein
MINKKQRIKDVFYNNRNYIVPYTSLKHIDGIDVVKLPNELIVYWNDLDSKWKIADISLIELYTNKKQIDIEFNGEIIKAISNLDLTQQINNESITCVNVEWLVKFDKEKNVWIIIDRNSDEYKKYRKINI